MEIAVFETICRELAAFGFSGRLSLHLYNEPLLLKELESYVATAARLVPSAFIALYTNGDLLTGRRYQSLLDAGVHRFVVTRHDGDSFPARPFQQVQTPSDFEVSNRGGAVGRLRAPLFFPCFAPEEMLTVTVTGDVILCHEDASRRHVFGNLTRQSLSEIWHHSDLEAVRSHLAEGRRSRASSICAVCDCRINIRRGESI